MALQTWVARFVVNHGKVTEEGGRLRSFERRRIDESDVDLYVLAEPMGEKGEELTAQALDAIGRLFLQDRLSLTGGLMRSLRSTNQTLLDWNQRSLPRDQVSAGIAAAIVSGHTVYLAQSGPGIAYELSEGKLSRLAPEDLALAPLGEGELEPGMRRFDMTPGQLIVVASPALETLLDKERLEALLARGSDEALPELYLLTKDQPNFALFAISCSETEGEPPPPEEPPEAFVDLSSEASAAAPRTPALPSPDAGPEPPASPAPIIVSPPPVDISRPVVRLRSDQSIGRSEYVRTTGSDGGINLKFFDWRLLRLGFVVAAVLLVVAFVPGLVHQGRSQKLDTLVQSAQSQLDAAANEQDPGQKRHDLEETRRLASDALRMDAKNGSAADLIQQASAGLTAMDAVFDLGPMNSITTLSRQLTGDISIQAMTVGGDTAYLLDAKGGRVIAVSLAATGPPRTVYLDGETYAGTPAKKPMFLAWDDHDTGRLLVLDADRKLFEILPGALPNPLPLRHTSNWSSVSGMAAYDGNVYVLDPKGNQVYRYLPAQQGYDSEPTDLLSGQVNLANAQGITVAGDIYVYFKDGSVKRYQDGNDAGFTLAGIDRPIKAVIGLEDYASASELYLVDSSNKRIVVAGTDGTYKRQLVSSAFTDLRAVAVAPAGPTLYAVVGDALLSAPLPK